MKKRSWSIVLMLFLITLFATSCKNGGVPESKIKAAFASQDECLRNCDAREAQCWADYDNCTAPAAAELQAARNTCSHVPPDNRLECIGQAIKKYQDATAGCLANAKRCLAELNKCRTVCMIRVSDTLLTK
jgi:hypothetical protein